MGLFSRRSVKACSAPAPDCLSLRFCAFAGPLMLNTFHTGQAQDSVRL